MLGSRVTMANQAEGRVTSHAKPAEPTESHGFFDSAWRQFGALLCVCALVYWLWLGTPGFAASEGHRVVPGWTMLQTGEWLRLRMFDLTYIRKPPGMPWAIAAFGWLFGESEWSARAVSAACATLAVFACWWFARKWFGAAAGFAAAMAQALMPLLWLPGGPGRTAEIEMLLLFGTQLGAMSLVHLAIGSAIRRAGGRATSDGAQGGGGCPAHYMLFAMAGCAVAGVAKGVAALPVLAGVLLAVIVTRRSWRCAINWRVLVPVVIGVGAAAGIVLTVFARNDDPHAVRETGEFLWTSPLRSLTVLPIAWVSALPVSLAWLFVWGGDARREASLNAGSAGEGNMARAYTFAKALGLAWLFAAVIYTVVGVGNPRYLLPASVLLPPLVGYVWLGAFGNGASRSAQLRGGAQSKELRFVPQRVRIARAMFLGKPAASAVLLTGGAMVAAYIFSHREQAHAGERAARKIAEALSGHGQDETVVFVDGVLEARPDVLLYAERELTRIAATRGDVPQAKFVWWKPIPSASEWRQITRERAAQRSAGDRSGETGGVGDATAKNGAAAKDWSLAGRALWLVRIDERGDERSAVPGGTEAMRARVGQFEFALMMPAANGAGSGPERDESDFFN